MRELVVAVVAVVAGCGSKAAPSGPMHHATITAPPTVSELTPALQPLEWLAGDWTSYDRDHDGGNTLHWVATSGTLLGVGLTFSSNFWMLMLDDGDGPGKPDGVLRLYAKLAGDGELTELRLRAHDGKSWTFANEGSKRTITLTDDGDHLTFTYENESPIDQSQTILFRKVAPSPAPDVETADRAFAADTAKRGIDGWVDAFADDGGMLRKGAIIARDKIAEAMGPLLASGKLAWEPIASGKLEKLGFTIGKARFIGAKPDDRWKSVYITVWRKVGPDAGTRWKVLLDGGRVVNEETGL